MDTPTRHRPMGVGDLDEVLNIERSAYSHPWTRGNFIDSLAAGYQAWLRLDAQGHCLGYCVAMAGFEEMHLLNITVAPWAQRQGHARTMLLELCDLCRRQELPVLWLEVRQSNTPARQLYRQFGFEEVGLRRDYYPNGPGLREDAVVMNLLVTEHGQGGGHVGGDVGGNVGGEGGGYALD